MKLLAINKIRIDGGTQFRSTINESKVTEYSDMLSESNSWPFDSACEVFFDGSLHYLVDGFHRYMAAVRSKTQTISCNVQDGTLRDAIKFALSANAKHGLHRSNDDKRMAVVFALSDAEWSKLSSRAIADLCGVSPAFIDSNRKTTANERQSPDKRTGKDGREYKQSEPKSKPKAEQPAAPKRDAWEDVEPVVAKPEISEQENLKANIHAIGEAATKTILKECKRLSELPGGEWLDLTEIETRCTLLRHLIRSGAYWIDCMDCAGNGCKTCRKTGWLSADRKKFLTQEQQDKISS